VNQKFRSANSKTRVDDLAQDCKDGMVLLELLEIMSGKNFGDKRPKPQKVRIKQIDNCVTVLGFAKDCGITTTCSAENIVDGEEKPLMAFIYQIIIKYMKLDEDDEDSAGMDVKQALIMWLRNKLQGGAIFSPLLSIWGALGARVETRLGRKKEEEKERGREGAWRGWMEGGRRRATRRGFSPHHLHSSSTFILFYSKFLIFFFKSCSIWFIFLSFFLSASSLPPS
jgi:hypothetical protein